MHQALQRIFNEIGTCLLVIDARRRVRFTNRTANELFGLASGDSLPPLLDRLLVDATEGLVQLPFRSPLPKDVLAPQSVQGETGDAQLVVLASPSPGEFVLLIEDIRAERFYLSALDNVRTLIDGEQTIALETFAAQLDRLLAALELQRVEPRHPGITKLADEALHTGRSLLATARRLLLLLDACDGERIAEVQPLNPASFLEKAIWQLTPKAESRGIRIIFSHPQPLVGRVWANPAWLLQAFAECLDNAVSFGRVNHEVVVEIRQQGNFVFITISNESITTSPMLKRFGALPLYTTGSLPPRAPKRLGIGLPLVKRLVEGFGGKLAFNQQNDGFFRCRLELPTGGTPDKQSGISADQAAFFARDIARLLSGSTETATNEAQPLPDNHNRKVTP